MTVVFWLICLLALTAIYQVQQNRAEELRMEYIARTIQAETYETLVLRMDKTRCHRGWPAS